MALTYSLKYKKLNFFNKVILEKEGEVVIDRQSFRLKGKGAQDHGESIYFGDIKELHVKEDWLSFSTFAKEKYVLSNFSNLFDAFLKDFIRIRNDYLADTLFMKVGMLMHEYDGSVEIENAYGKFISKGKSRIQFYEGSIVIIPETRECFPVYFGHLKGHEFDGDEYVLHLFLENGQNIHVSKFGTSFEDAKETMESLLGKMYERVINSLREYLPGLDATTLLKLVYILKQGRFVTMKALKKIHDDLPDKVEEFMFKDNPAMKEKVEILMKEGGKDNFHVSLSFGKNRNTGEGFSRVWFMQPVPEKNLITIGRTSGENDSTIHFFRIIMQHGEALDKLPAKILEIDQAMLIFGFDFSVVYKGRHELRKSKFRTALKRLSFLRLLRKSYIGHNTAVDSKQFKIDLKKFFDKASISPT